MEKRIPRGARSSLPHAAWPVDAVGLAALIDLGLSTGQLAAYFGVSPDDIEMLRDQYDLAHRRQG